MIAEAWNESRTVHFASLMDLCHLQNSELEPQFQPDVLRGDIVKDDSGSFAELTEQGSSASQMTAAKVMDIYQSYQDAQDKQQTQYLLTPGQNGRCTITVKKNPTSECPDICIRLPYHRWPKSWSSMEDPVAEHGWEKVPT